MRELRKDATASSNCGLMTYFIGLDGGGTRTTLGIADASGRELLRSVGPPGLVDPRRPEATADLLVAFVREVFAGARFGLPATAFCAGLAGVGNAPERDSVKARFIEAGIADRVEVVTDSEIAMSGALGEGAGILLIAGTGSVAWGRAEGGRVERSGGWGMIVGDEGSGFHLAQSGLSAALRSHDGRGPSTALLRALLDATGVETAAGIPSWAAQAGKGGIAHLATHVLRVAAIGDEVALELVDGCVTALVAHVEALAHRLRPWSEPPRVVLHGGLARDAFFRSHLTSALASASTLVRLIEPAADAVTGALNCARAMARPDVEEVAAV